MLFGRAFEQAVAALSRREDPAVLFEQWGVCKDMGLTYSGNDNWDRMLQQGIQLLDRFAQDGRVRIRRLRSTQQIQFTRTLASGNGRFDPAGDRSTLFSHFRDTTFGVRVFLAN